MLELVQEDIKGLSRGLGADRSLPRRFHKRRSRRNFDRVTAHFLGMPTAMVAKEKSKIYGNERGLKLFTNVEECRCFRKERVEKVVELEVALH